ncbi:hypothetical protein AX14_006252 [Amanita brunnescens Koide BX004]|nr:hypothetical protein AX14_006252 [Amanita brunnescens Koide BX004]
MPTPTPSLVSDCPSASPSRRVVSCCSAISNGFHCFPKGLQSPPLCFVIGWLARKFSTPRSSPPEDVTNHFDALYHLQVPKTLAQAPLPTHLHNQAEFQLAVRTWASTLSSVAGDTCIEGDEYGILTALPYLALAYSRVRKTSNNHSKEHTQRSGIDDVIELAFSSMLDRHCDFITEQSYRLVASTGNPDAQSNASATISLGTVGHKIRKALPHGDPTLSRQLYWSTGAERDDFSIIGFAGEFKRDDNECNENQLIMVLATAQAQRKALSLKPSIIMRATACRGRVPR